MKHLLDYINATEDPAVNFKLAREYEELGQTGPAISFYLRSADRSDDTILQYEALLRMALCFERQRIRERTEKVVLQKAIAFQPTRPEAYFLLSRLHEQQREWQDSYNMAVIGLELATHTSEPLSTDVEYPGYYGLLFQKGVAAWWVGLCEEARVIMEELKFHYPLDERHRRAVDNNLSKLGYPNTTIKYTGAMSNQLRCEFTGSDTIDRNYSQSLQDIFVLAATDGKRSGSYVEIGSAEPHYNNNTALLESLFKWRGISIDIDRVKVQDFISKRNNPALCLDATAIDYSRLFKSYQLPDNIDYLQVDCDPPEISLQILKRIPFDQYRFGVITFEHDYYYNKTIRDESREFLRSHGYQLVVGDVAYNTKNSYEDWWCHPDLIDPSIIQRLTDISDRPKWAKNYMFKS